MDNAHYALFNTMGQLVYAGKNIETEDFSELGGGIYMGEGVVTVRVRKV